MGINANLPLTIDARDERHLLRIVFQNFFQNLAGVFTVRGHCDSNFHKNFNLFQSLGNTNTSIQFSFWAICEINCGKMTDCCHLLHSISFKLPLSTGMLVGSRQNVSGVFALDGPRNSPFQIHVCFGAGFEINWVKITVACQEVLFRLGSADHDHSLASIIWNPTVLMYLWINVNNFRIRRARMNWKECRQIFMIPEASMIHLFIYANESINNLSENVVVSIIKF